jgi:hypothetical protein
MKRITIGFSDDELKEMLDGKTFDWEFDGVKVHLFRED